jgi:general secretion pathway protein G
LTLVELLIAIVILGVLAAIVLIAVGAFQDRGQSASCDADINTVGTAVEAYRAKEGHYPASLSDLTTAPQNYLRELPNTTENTGEYWIIYDSSTGQVRGVLKGGTPCTASAFGSAGPGSTSTGGGGGPGDPSPSSSTSTGPGPTSSTSTGPNPTSSTSTDPGPSPTTTSTSTGPDPSPTSTGPNLPRQPVLEDSQCVGVGGLSACWAQIEWPRVHGDSIVYVWQNVRRSVDGSCDFEYGGDPRQGFAIDLIWWGGAWPHVTLPLLDNSTSYCFRVRPSDTLEWSSVLRYRTHA